MNWGIQGLRTTTVPRVREPVFAFGRRHAGGSCGAVWGSLNSPSNAVRGAADSERLQMREVLVASPTESTTGFLASRIASLAQVGDVICLYGPVGAGKSVFSRQFVRSVVGSQHLVVPSPTFVLQHQYEFPARRPVHHFDMYRLRPPFNAERLGFEESFSTAISLIEWAERLGDTAPPNRLDIHFRLLESSEDMSGAFCLDKAAMKIAEESSLSVDLPQESKHEEGEEGSLEDFLDSRLRLIAMVGQGERWMSLAQKILPPVESEQYR